MPPLRTDSPFSAWLRLGAAAACLGAALTGCEPMDSRGEIFAPAPRAAMPATAEAAPADPAFTFPSEPPLVLSSEEMAKGDLASVAEAAGVDPTKLPPVEAPSTAPVEVTAQVAPAAPPAVGVPSLVQWPVRLVSTIPQAQPPRAILGLPSGEERVVSPGSILADQGLVVMAVSGDRVTLAKIEPAGDHARIATVELTAQYAATVSTR